MEDDSSLYYMLTFENYLYDIFIRILEGVHMLPKAEKEILELRLL